MKTTALVLLFALAACVRCVAGTTGVMNGYVRDEKGQPAADALVTVVSPTQVSETHTDEHGFFVFLMLPPDVYSVHVEKAATSNAYTMAVRINSDQTTFMNFRVINYWRCPLFAPITLANDRRGEQFVSLDVRQLATYPPNAAPPILLPALPHGRGLTCL